MIHYQLQCRQAHAFDGWFKDSATFEEQARRQLVECPECGDTKVERALMAPAVAKRQDLAVAEPQSPQVRQKPEAPVAPDKLAGGRVPAQMLAVLQRIRAEVEKNCDYVGAQFTDEARKMHRGETEHRGIYGEATEEQAQSLAEDGISVGRIPWVPRADG
jgi:hypothetical protein